MINPLPPPPSPITPVTISCVPAQVLMVASLFRVMLPAHALAPEKLKRVPGLKLSDAKGGMTENPVARVTVICVALSTEAT